MRYSIKVRCWKRNLRYGQEEIRFSISVVGVDIPHTIVERMLHDLNNDKEYLLQLEEDVRTTPTPTDIERDKKKLRETLGLNQ